MTVIEKIEAQQQGCEGTDRWVVGEQLKEICRHEKESAELLDKDLDAEGMSLADAAKQIKAYADKHRKGNFSYVAPDVAEGILREFYGLPGRMADEPKKTGKLLSLEDFL